MNKLIYPAIFTPEKGGGYVIEFPDFPYITTQGKDMADAYYMGQDALFLAVTTLEKGEKLPIPTPFEALKPENDGILVVIVLDLEEHAKKTSRRCVKKTLTIPEWLNEACVSAGINFSEVLQIALKKELGIY